MFTLIFPSKSIVFPSLAIATLFSKPFSTTISPFDLIFPPLVKSPIASLLSPVIDRTPVFKFNSPFEETTPIEFSEFSILIL